MPRLLLVRHAQSVWNAEGRWQGWADPPLSSFGEDQAGRAGATLPVVPDAVAASDLQRARRTAELLSAAAAGPGEVSIDPGLREYDAGEWTGLRRDEIAARWPDQLAGWDSGALDRAPGGEPYGLFVERLMEALRRLSAPAGPGTTVAVTHGRALAAVAGALGTPISHVGHLTGLELQIGAPGGGTGPEITVVRPVDLLSPGGSAVPCVAPVTAGAEIPPAPDPAPSPGPAASPPGGAGDA